MNTCVNIEASEFKALKERSGLSDFLLEVLVGDYQDSHNGAWPRLDELPFEWMDSKKALDQFLGLSKNSVISQKDLIEKAGIDPNSENALKRSIDWLRNIYSNLDIGYYTINDKVKIVIDTRPNPFKVVHNDPVDLSQLASSAYIRKSLDELEEKMGIVTHSASTKELSKLGILDAIPEASDAAAFVYEGEIYINEDNASADSRAHELMHVLLGGIKFKNPQLYAQLTGTVEDLENYQDLIRTYPNRARQDINEEIFVREYARMLTGLSSLLENLDPDIIYNVNYEMSRVLDTMLRGDNSVRLIPAKERFEKTFKELGEIVNSHNMENTLQTYIDGAIMHRILANKKSDLMANGTLTEYCD